MEISPLCLLIILCMGVHSVPEEFLLRQKRNWIIESFTIYENYSGSFPYYLGKVNINQGLNIIQITGQGLNEEPKQVIEINEKSGRIYVLKPVDYERYQILRVILSAKSKENHTQTKVGINFEIIDANDNPPIFNKTTYETTINESTLQGTELINVTATDNDIRGEHNKFFFSIDSVTPEPDDMEFFINKEPYFDSGTISFKGCLNRKKANKYTLIVKATDPEKPEQLFNFTTVIINIETGNRHLPEFTNQSGPISVKEGQTDVILSRLQVKDEDTRGTKAWKAIYKIQGDENNNFGITTDPQTNEGLLRVNKELDYENESSKNIVITVENEIPYFTCKVMARNITGLWKIKTDPASSLFSGPSVGNGTGGGGTLSRYQLTVVVEDVNEPPVFDRLQPVSVSETVEVGHYLGTMVARDPDVRNTPVVRYFKAEDPANWFTVDPKTGKITTSSILDKESPFTKDKIYVITINAVDNGSPPQTGTASLSIYIINENDNAPSLIVSTFDICVNDKFSWVNVTAVDADEEPFGGPFSFHLLGDVENSWRIDPVQGVVVAELGRSMCFIRKFCEQDISGKRYSVKLVKGEKVYPGNHTLKLKVVDFQGKKAVHSLSITVCKCSDVTRPYCRLGKATGSRVGAGTLWVIFFSIILLIGLVMFTVLVSCKPQRVIIPDDDDREHYLMKGNTEEPGTDCRVPLKSLNSRYNGQHMKILEDKMWTVTPVLADSVANTQACPNGMEFNQSRNSWKKSSVVSFRENWDMSSEVPPSAMGITNQQGTIRKEVWMEHAHEALLITALRTMLQTLEAPGEELGHYEPNEYADEGDFEHNFELDAISNPEAPFDSDMELDSRFLALASICSPDMSA